MRGFAIIIGIILIVLGILGLFPDMISNGRLFNVFRVNWAVIVLYLITGILGIIIGLSTYFGTRVFFEIVGICYAIWAILGFVYLQSPIFGFIANNMGTTWLNVVIAVIALILGFGSTQKRTDL